MTEQTRSRPREAGGSGDNPFSDDPLGNLVTIISSGGQREVLPLAGMTVGEVRRRFADRLNIGAEAQAMIGTQNVADDVVLQGNQQLFFRRAAGEKG